MPNTPTPLAPHPQLSHYRGAVAVLAGGILLQALNAYVTSSLLPDLVAEIGGEPFYAWVASLYFVASVSAAMLSSRALLKLGARTAFVVGFGVFAIGCVVAALAPGMEIFLVSRVLQGLGGGLLAGLSFATIRSALPQPLWSQGTAIVSAMFAIGTLVGPALGGAFAQAGIWRLAFVVLAALGLALTALVPRALPNTARSNDVGQIPFASMAALTLAVLAMSLAGVLGGAGTWVALGVGALLIGAFVVAERFGSTSVLPRFTYRRGNSLKWLYLTIALGSAAVVTEAFTPLFGQRLIGLEPLVAGFLGATVSAGWSAAAIPSSRAQSPTTRRRLSMFGPLLSAVALGATAVLQLATPSGLSVLAWAITLFIAGMGIGLSNPHLAVAVMSSTDDGRLAAQAAAGVPIVSQMGQMLFVALGGAFVTAGMPHVPQAAANLSFGIAVISALGALTAWVAFRRRDS